MKKRRPFSQHRSVQRSSRSASPRLQFRRAAFEGLENRCLLSSVGFSPIANVTLPAGTALYVPLNATDSGQQVSFAASVSDFSKVTPVVMPQTDNSLQMNISGISTPMVFQLFDTLSPSTTAHIETLVNSGFYNGLQIYRNGKDQSGNPFVIQGGNDPPTGAIKTDVSSIAEEFNPNLQYTAAGMLAMARQTAPGTSSSEFFITEEAARFLDYNYTAFGFQTVGQTVDQAIAAMANQNSTQDPNGIGYLVTPLTISTATIFTDSQNGVLQLRAPAGMTGTVTVTVIASDGTNTPTSQTFTVTIVADDPSNAANPFASQVPAAPTSVAYVPPSGGSTQLTDLNNSAGDETLDFQVSGVTSGNVVEILADGNVIGQATASETTVTVTTDGSTMLTDGSHVITAIQIAPDQTVSVSESGGSSATNQTADVPSLSSPSVQLDVDATPPTVTINQATTQPDPINVGPIHFTAVFSDAVTDFDASDVTLGGTATGTMTATVTPSGTDGTTFDVAVSGMTGSGTVTASIAAGGAHDTAGNGNTASTSTDNTVTFDTDALTVTMNQATGQADPTNVAPVHYTVVFLRAVSDFTSADVTLSGTAPGTLTATVTETGSDGTTYDVAVSGMTGSGTIVASLAAGVAHDTSDKPNLASTSTDGLINYDITQPTVTINQASTQLDPINVGPIHFTAVFSKPVTGFAADDVTLGGTAAGTLTATVTASGTDGTTYDVAVSGMSGTGTVTASIAAGGALDTVGNGNAASTSTDNQVTFDLTPPDVTVNQASTQADPTNAGPIHFTAVFSEAVSDFSASDVTLGGTATGTLTATITASGTDGKTYDVAISGMTASGTVTAGINAGVVHDLAGNTNNVSTSTDNVVNYDTDALTVTVNQGSTQVDPTDTAPIHFTVVFLRAVTDFTSDDVTLSGTAPGTLTATVTASGTDGTTYDVAVSGMTGTGTVIASLAAGVAHDASDKPNLASTSTDAQVTYDVTAPTVTIDQASTQLDPINVGPIHFTAVFSKAVTDFTASDVTLGGTATGALTATITAIGSGGTTYDVAVSGMTGGGTVTASIAAGTVHDAAGNANTASTSTDAQVTYDITAPVVTINQASTQTDPTGTDPIHFTVVFSEAVSDFTAADVTLGGTVAGTLAATVTASGSDGTTYDVAVSGMVGSGTVTATIAAGAAHDTAGNASAASTSTDNQVTFQSSSSTVKLFDFGTSSSPVRAGYTQVTDQTVYSSSQGYGWNSGTIYSADRATGSDSDRDLNFTADGTFAVDLANGTYQVDLRMGDLGSYLHDQMAIYLQGNQIDTATTNAGQLVDKIYTVKVTSGQLDLRLKDMGDLDPFAVIESLTVTSVADITTGPTTTVSLTPWQSPTAATQPIYFAVAFSEPVTGFTSSSVTVGGTATQGTLNTVVTGAGTNYTVAVSGFTTAGTVTLGVNAAAATGLSGNQNQASASATTDNTVTYASPTTVLKYQFGTATSPLATSFTRVTDSTTYSSTAGFGWQSGTIHSWDRGNGSAIDEAFNFTTDGTFQVDLPNGTYQVDVSLGDTGNFAHDQMGILLQGNQVDSVSTLAGQMVTESYTINITGGQLSLELKDQGDLDPNAVIHSLVISSASADTTAPTVAISLAPWQPATAVAQPLYFAVSFSEPVTGFTSSSVTIGGTATQGSLTKTVTGAGANYVVAVSGFSASGTVTLNVSAAMATDLSGNQNQAAAGPVTVTYNKPSIVYQYAFGTTDTPLPDDYTRVTGQTVYAGTSQPDGWTSGTLASWDRGGTAAALVRGLNFASDGTFEADVPNGAYRIDLIMGDLGRFAHDQVGVYLQGDTSPRDTVSTAAGQVVDKEYDSVTVNNGHLVVHLKDLGGADPNAVIEAIDIALIQST